MYKKDVELKNKELYSEDYRVCREKLQKAMDNALKRLEKSVDRFYDKFPTNKCGWNTEHERGWSNNRYVSEEQIIWTTGMWTGIYWLAYMFTKEPVYLKAAENHLKSYVMVAEKATCLDDHDTGFKFTPSCVAAYKITGNEAAKGAALKAADIMLKHYCYEQNFIIRTGDGSDKYKYEDFRTLVDSMMNIPLLFWAYNETGDKRYYDAAVGHYRTTAKFLIREDGSSFHHYQFDPVTKAPVCGCTFQGFKDESCWSRGHSWLMYGYPVAYKYTKDEEIIDIHKAVSYYFMDHLPSNFIPFWDFTFREGSFEPRDSSAAAIAACGLLEICKFLPDTCNEKALFKNAAHHMVNSLIDYCENTREDEDGLILHVTGSKPHNSNIDSIAIFGDYFYFESLVRLLSPEIEMFW